MIIPPPKGSTEQCNVNSVRGIVLVLWFSLYVKSLKIRVVKMTVNMKTGLVLLMMVVYFAAANPAPEPEPEPGQ
ncbi:hypothetical protein TNCV_4094671 [Trichonephila clavipes]|uniref:Uncharacterized protein n=1 Tax=Trichonephila clavipes TaxID=2585209 RepID=A0A8X6V7D1_TRICX|nr:hypothetical protein TNCV_4094671 [Trichonephila clavipes]